jgi:polyisoprenoid-binding protein YceI
VRVRSLSLACTLLAVVGVTAERGPWRVEAPSVRVVCPLTIGGSFEARTSALSGTLTVAAPRAPLAGDLAVDLRTLDTGIALRNTHLLNTYLEVDKAEGFDRAVLSNIVVAADLESFSGRTTFTGDLRLHGGTKTVQGEAELERSGPSLRVSAAFPVVLADFGIASPRYLGVGVRDRVQVRVAFVATALSAGVSSR